MFLMLYSPLDTALLLVLLQPSGDGYFWLCSSKSSFRGTVTKLKHTFESYLFSTSCEEGKCVLYSENGPIKDAPKPTAVLSRLHYILQATSLRWTVYTKTKLATTAHVEVGSLLLFPLKLLLHTVYIFNIFMWTEVIVSKRL